MGRRGRAVALGAAVAVTVVFALGWMAARRFESPAQRDAAARPPAARPVFADVERGELVDRADARGTVSAAVQDKLVAMASPANAVVTATHARVGDQVDNGARLLSVNGSPVFLVSSPFAFYRDLVPGATGPDVGQLQIALRTAGFHVPVTENARFGEATTAAVRRLLARSGAAADTAGSTPASLSLSQIVTVRHLPARLSRLAPVGSPIVPGDQLGVLERGPLEVRASVTSAAAAVMTAGMSATLQAPDGTKADLTVHHVSGQQSQEEQGGTVDVLLRPTEPLRPDLRGASLLVTVVIKKVSATALIVPARAVARSANGRTRVLKRTPTGLEAVAVRVLGTLNGSVAVRPAAPGGLTEDDFVQVG